ncbi:tetratricopeptide repeat protein 29 isoform X2 [Pseudoliparis swirei]|uniref:tetratricopeptide repeat protein 29 isoform X2 n=1 Tax=Pseudoliparis swirei TaxID=2059687 RepID=UPI0024BDA29E|nr:tetratricopeptide repeat protein 29 isoform X2 [Pseudoliparis swirei]
MKTGPDQRMSKPEVSRFRNSLKQNICVEMLQDSYYRSFSELFSLLTSDRNRRAAAEPGSDTLLLTPLDQQGATLETMRLHLRQAEEAENTACWSVVCEQRLLLGLFFSSREEDSLALHFFTSCAETERGGASGHASEALVCMAEIYLQRGELQRARLLAQCCLLQADEGGWLDSGLRPLGVRVRGTLWRICSRMADAHLEASHLDLDRALDLLQQGHTAAAESGDKQLESEACHQLGLTNQRAGRHCTAQQFFKSCIQIYSTLQDADGLGKTYKALASEGDTHDRLQCLEKMADLYLSSGQQSGLTDALLRVGSIYFKRGQYMRASEYFLQSFELSSELGDLSLLQKAQVWLGCARARALIRGHSADVGGSSGAALQRLLTRKESRGLGPETLPLPGSNADE